MKDRYNRTVDYLRISVTDRCNLNCVYCTSSKGVELLPQGELLTYEEMIEISRAAVACGIRKIRITGGEPLVRRDIEGLVSEISRIEGLVDLSLTTNGILLSEMAEPLRRAGLKRINISLDTLDPERYSHLTGGGSLKKVLAGVDSALAAGFDPVKINAVLVDESVEDDIDSFLDLVYRKPVHVRFIEKMEFDDDCGTAGGTSCARIIEKVSERVELEETEGPLGFGPATYVRPKGAKGTLGFICPYSRHFCDRCNRLRLTADGRLRPCLFSDAEIDLKKLLREGGFSGQALAERISEALLLKPESFKSALRKGRRTMRQIGG